MFGERPLDRPPLPIVDFQFQMSRAFGVLGLPGNLVSDIARFCLFMPANLLVSQAKLGDAPGGGDSPPVVKDIAGR